MTLASRFSNMRRRMRANATRGSAALEFAFIAPVFFTLLFGIHLETGIMYFAGFALQNATLPRRAPSAPATPKATSYATAAQCAGGQMTRARAVLTASSQEWYKDQICCGISSLMSCTNLHVNVQSFLKQVHGRQTACTQVGGLYQPVTDSYSPGDRLQRRAGPRHL